MTKTYTLELTAEEVEYLHLAGTVPEGAPREVLAKVRALRDQAFADREANELRLPWGAKKIDGLWTVVGSVSVDWAISARAARLMSAAPELLEAVQALKVWRDDSEGFDLPSPLLDCIRRALRKVETGTPEAP